MEEKPTDGVDGLGSMGSMGRWDGEDGHGVREGALLSSCNNVDLQTCFCHQKTPLPDGDQLGPIQPRPTYPLFLILPIRRPACAAATPVIWRFRKGLAPYFRGGSVCLMSRLHPCEGCLSWPLEEKTTAEGSLARGKQSTTLAHDILPPIHDWMLRAE